VEALLAALEASDLAATMRRSVWLYPAANVLHVLGLMGFFAAVAAMDVAAFRADGAAALRRRVAALRPVALAFFALQVATGVLLFLPEATHIWHNAAFLLKLAAIAFAFANVALFEIALGRASPEAFAGVPGGVRAAAVASLALWLAVATLGRLIAYA
jgi:hypothetical protein